MFPAQRFSLPNVAAHDSNAPHPVRPRFPTERSWRCVGVLGVAIARTADGARAGKPHTSSPEDMFGDAPYVANMIGAKDAVAFDLTAACSGFLFATVTAGQYLSGGGYKNAMVIGADALSRWVDWSDRNSCVLFGDGAGSCV